MPESALESDNFEPVCSIDETFASDDVLCLSDSEASAHAGGDGFWSWRAASHAGAPSSARSSSGGASVWLGQFAKAYGQTWLWYAFTALFFGLVCNGIFGIPLWQVVDVNLALFLSWVAFVGGILLLILGIEIFNGEFGDALVTVLLMVAYTFLPFGVITGYMAYGWLGGGQVSDASFVYEGFVGIFVKGYTALSSVFGDVFGAVEVRETATGAISTIRSDVVMQWTQIVAGALAAVDILARWIRRGGEA